MPSCDDEDADDEGTLLDPLLLSELSFDIFPLLLPRVRLEWADRLEAVWDSDADEAYLLMLLEIRESKKSKFTDVDAERGKYLNLNTYVTFNINNKIILEIPNTNNK